MNTNRTYTVTREGREWLVIFDVIAARTLGLSPVLGGYTTRRAACDAGDLLTEGYTGLVYGGL